MEPVRLCLCLAALLLLAGGGGVRAQDPAFAAKVAKIIIGASSAAEAVQTFGEPLSYIWGQQTFDKDNLPATYLARYDNGFSVCISGGKVIELRFERPGFVYMERLQVGTPLEDVLEIAPPLMLVKGEPLPSSPVDGVLYQDAGGRPGYGYYARPDIGARFFFADARISALYLIPKRALQPLVPAFNPNSTEPFQVDLRSRNLSALDLRGRAEDLLNASFDARTVWPPASLLPEGFDAAAIMDLGKNPGLGVRALHAQGITGRGVGVAILDSPLVKSHPEWEGRLAVYEEFNLEGQTQPHMHGNAVASIAVGRTCGVAPEAELYYIATWIGGAGSGGRDFANLAQGIRRVLEINRALPEERKIRVISASVGWSPSEKNAAEVQLAAAEARAAGMLVICSSVEEVHGFKFHALGRPAMADPDQFESYGPGMFWAGDFYRGWRFNDRLLAPMDSRTTASERSGTDYVFYRHGGWSWTIPYIAGLYALAAQVDPGITPEKFWTAAMATGRTTKLSYKGEEIPFGPIVDPAALMAALKR